MAEYLKIDEQTISDLSIFGKSGKASVYDLYNTTKTQGGGAKLELLFRHPLSDEALINERAELYSFFSKDDYQFPVDADTAGAFAYYMKNEDIRSQLIVGGQSVTQKLRDFVAADPEYVFVYTGVQAGLRLFYQLGQFVASVDTIAAGTSFEPYLDRLSALLRDPEFEIFRGYVTEKYETKLKMHTLAELDVLIRFDKRELMLELLEIMYDLDVFIAVGQVARKRNFNFATAMPKNSGVLHYKKVFHPHVENAVANNLFLNTHQNILFLTGANMAGKSTLMKSVGVALYLGHMGFPVAAEEFEFSVRDGIFTSINLADNLSAGASHYYAEVLRVKEVAMELKEGKQLFVIFDELFRGTNVKDAYDATIALTKAFCNKKNSQFIVSTHIMEAGEVLQNESLSIKYQFLPTEMNGNVPVYTRILREGITADRQGMVIIQNEGIIEMLDAGIKQKEELCLS